MLLWEKQLGVGNPNFPTQSAWKNRWGRPTAGTPRCFTPPWIRPVDVVMGRVASGWSCSSMGIFKNKQLCHGKKYKIIELGSLTRVFFISFLLITPRSDRLVRTSCTVHRDTQRKQELSLPLDRLFKLNHRGVMYHDASCCVLHGMGQSRRANDSNDTGMNNAGTCTAQNLFSQTMSNLFLFLSPINTFSKALFQQNCTSMDGLLLVDSFNSHVS